MAPKVTINTIRRDLMAQLKSRGLSEVYYVDMVDDYIKLWQTKDELVKDIEKRGVTTMWGSNIKKNDSIAELTKVLSQMSKILDWLGLKPPADAVASDGQLEM